VLVKRADRETFPPTCATSPLNGFFDSSKKRKFTYSMQECRIIEGVGCFRRQNNRNGEED
jgi:hypothetical protein